MGRFVVGRVFLGDRLMGRPLSLSGGT
jgi:hypothetical protein